MGGKKGEIEAWREGGPREKGKKTLLEKGTRRKRGGIQRRGEEKYRGGPLYLNRKEGGECYKNQCGGSGPVFKGRVVGKNFWAKNHFANSLKRV